MKYKEQLDRMVESGILSEEQSGKINESLSRKTTINENNQSGGKKFPLFLAILIIFLVISFSALVASEGGETTKTVEDISKTLNQSGGIGTMNSITSGIFAIAIFLILPILMFVYFHNSIVDKEEEVRNAWAQVESNYQRRADLIPNLIETVSRYMKHEANTLKKVTGQRGMDISDTVEALVNAQSEGSQLLGESSGQAPTDETYIASLNATQQRVGGLMNRLLATVENYPDLRSSEQMLELQAQLEGTENRINVARMRFNESVSDFNGSIRRLPGSAIASIGNFSRKAYFKADDGANKVQKVNFDDE